jgi:DNA-binding GntR family transcriptional regulator
MEFNEHCMRCRKRFGEDFDYVHLWLDEFYGSDQYKTKHRKLRHHKKGIEEVRQRWGDRAAEAAKLHIIDDLQAIEDKKADESWIADNEADYVRRGYW